MSAYLSSKGWQVEEKGATEIWTHNGADGKEATHFTVEAADADFTGRIRALLPQLVQIEGRSQQDILAEMAHANADMMRISLVSEEPGDSRLTLENSVRLLQGTQRLLSAAAWATVEPSPNLVGKKPPQVAQFIRTVKIGALELDGCAQAATAPLREIDQETISRRVMLTVAQALDDLERLTPNASVLLDTDVRRKMIDRGISANLCDAVVTMFGKPNPDAKGRGKRLGEGGTRLVISYVWSPMLAVPQNTPAGASFDMDKIEALKDLSGALKETSPKENFQLQGLVTDLRRTGKDGVGKISVTNVTREQPDKVTLELEDALYEIAIQAHKDKLPVMCVGTLVRNNKSYELMEPSLAIAEGMPLPASS